jgi:putative transposase
MLPTNVVLTGEKTKGRKRHIITDILGNILSIRVHAANIHDTMSGSFPLERALEKYPTVIGVCADAGYRGTFKNLCEDIDLKCDIFEKIKPKEWAILPKIWRIERTFSLFCGYRRLSKDYEITIISAESMALISHSRLLLRRLIY